MRKILDACCGSRMFWFDKGNPDVDFCDIRILKDTLCDGRSLEIKPDIVCDFTKLPMKDNTYYLVVFDPPHLINVGDNSWLAKKYGKLPKDNLQEVLQKGFCIDFFRHNVTSPLNSNDERAGFVTYFFALHLYNNLEGV